MKYNFDIDERVKIGNPDLVLPTIIQLKGEINEDIAAGFMDAMIAAENSEQEIIPIVIDSFGGDVYAMFSMIDVIKSSKKIVSTIVVGKIMSAAVLIYSCGTDGYRFISPNSTVMIHHASQDGGDNGNPYETKTSSEQLTKINENALELLAENCGKPKKYFKQLLTKNNHCDLYLSAEEAVKHNIANKIRIPEFNVKVKMSYTFD